MARRRPRPAGPDLFGPPDPPPKPAPPKGPPPRVASRPTDPAPPKGPAKQAALIADAAPPKAEARPKSAWGKAVFKMSPEAKQLQEAGGDALGALLDIGRVIDPKEDDFWHDALNMIDRWEAEAMSDAAKRCPFAVVIDTREQLPYAFRGLPRNADEGGGTWDVTTIRRALPVGDYAIDGLAKCVVERKSKEDLYASVGQRRDNFEFRLYGMCMNYEVAAVVVECERYDLIANAPEHSRLSPKSLNRTITSWEQRFPLVHWSFMPNRATAEAMTFRILERCWKDRQKEEIIPFIRYDWVREYMKRRMAGEDVDNMDVGKSVPGGFSLAYPNPVRDA